MSFSSQTTPKSQTSRGKNYSKEMFDRIDMARIPRHIGIIMDGNGRWAREHGYPRSRGHEKGAETIERLVDVVHDLRIPAISLYSFSKENWNRPREEVRFLWKLLIRFFHKKMHKLQEYNMRVLHSGDRHDLPRAVNSAIGKAIQRTKDNTGTVLNYCVNYGGRQEVERAFRLWLQDNWHRLRESSAPGELFFLEEMESYLFTRDLPPLDLVIRTSGEMRLSNFLIWQAAYSEFWSCSKYWPNFEPDDLLQALLDYQNRDRRFGGV